MVNAYGIEDVEKGKSQEIPINDGFQKLQNWKPVKNYPQI